MFVLPLFFYIYFVQFSSAFYNTGSGGLFGFVFGFQKLCFCRCGIAHKPRLDNYLIRSGRLLGGESISPHQFPWLTVVTTGSQTFGGSLISDQHIVTSASPLYGIPASHISVTLGSHDRCVVGGDTALNSSVESVIIHPAYSRTNMDNDVALLRLRHVVAFSQFVSPICMPFYGQSDAEKVAWTAAWVENTTTTCTPRVVTLPVLPLQACLKGALDNKLVTHDKGCLGPLGAKSVVCKADVGAPVMVKWASTFRLIGVVTEASMCDQKVTPLYTKIVDHAAWIHDHIRADCQCF